jgi:hypothetical protein
MAKARAYLPRSHVDGGTAERGELLLWMRRCCRKLGAHLLGLLHDRLSYNEGHASPSCLLPQCPKKRQCFMLPQSRLYAHISSVCSVT